MLTENNTYAFCADYSSLSACLFAIQTAEENGSFANDELLIQLLNRFENDLLRKLYFRTIRLLGALYQVDGVPQTYLGGDFTNRDFILRDFNIGYLQTNGPITDLSAYLAGDFEDEDFTHLDFWVGFQDLENAGYASVFKTITNIFAELCSRSSEISNGEKWVLDAALLPFLDGFDELKAYLQNKGLNLCTDTEVINNNDAGVFLQASGSNGTTGVAEGLHLRWALSGELGENHIPKGSYYNDKTAQGLFNRANDYVRIYRTTYLSPVLVTLDFEAKRPVINFGLKTWSYVLVNTIGALKITNRVKLIFEDAGLYNQLALTLDPQLYFYDFLKSYTGIIRVELVKKSGFRFSFGFGDNDGAAVLKIEANCFAGTDSANAQVVRKTFNSATTIAPEILADNIQSIRLKKTPGSVLKSISFETYDDFLKSRNESDWQEVGSGFGLSLDDALVYERLENENYQIDNLWPQYNQGTRVRVSNYQQKWSVSAPGEPSLKDAVLTYLSLSENDSRALDTIKKADATEFDQGFQISYVDVLNLQASDYHMARMLGLGHIDTEVSEGDDLKYIYQLRYLNRREITDNSFLEHRYTTLPVSKSDERLPEKPRIAPVSYGLPNPKAAGNGIFDVAGYTPLDRVRAVNITRIPYADEISLADFFSELSATVNENIFERPKAVAYGVEYRAQGQSSYQKPEIIQEKSLGKLFYAHDDDYPGLGVVETALVPDNEQSLYVHFERNQGVHFYAIYGVNWFSRASELSDEEATDATLFPKINTLVPPDNLTVQYLQKEETPVLTTSREQGWLAARENLFPGQDTALTRVTFNYTDIVDISPITDPNTSPTDIVRANEVKALFNPVLPLQLAGQINRIEPVGNTGEQLMLYLGSYLQINGELINPQVSSQDLFRFTNSILSTAQGQFKIVELLGGPTGLRVLIEKNKSYDTVSDSTESDYYGTRTKYTSPEPGSRFTITENLSKAENWNPLSARINIYSFADAANPVLETYTDSEGNISRFWIGGINEPAIITPLFGQGNTEDIAGLYKISFDSSFTLPVHPQGTVLPYDPGNAQANAPENLHSPFVEWYKGTVRLLTNGNEEKKTLEVLRIENTGILTLYVLDADYEQDPIIISSGTQDAVEVNFHPGYRVYYFAEPAGLFNAEHILPLGQENQRKTIFGLQVLDTRVNGSGFSSAVSIPGVLMSHRIVEPLKPDAPIITNQRVRADATGKASLTFDLKVNIGQGGNARKPFGFSFYRIAAEDVISSLYEQETVNEIYNELAKLTLDSFASQRFYELINLVFDENNPSSFNVFEALPNPYGFPVPDKASLVETGDDLQVRREKYESAILANLLPLTQQVPIFSFLKTGFQTENLAPVIRDLDGNLLLENDPAFNPFPMVRKYIKPEAPNDIYIRFTDYFLDESSRDHYFYAATETTNELVNGDLSLFSGPVSIINTIKPDIPVLAGFRINPAINGEAITVDFSINPIASVDQVSKIRVYRSITLSAIEHPVNIAPFFDVDVEVASLLGYQITDSFEDFFTIPYGDFLHYKFYAIRTIINEYGENEDIFSSGSTTINVKLIDTTNPTAPDIFYNQQDNLIWWPQTISNGNYYLYQQNTRGNWQRIFSSPSAGNQPIEYELPENLSFEDEEGNRIYYRFKVQVENSSGLFNLEEKELTI